MDKILSQEEIDALLRGMSEGQVDTNPEESDESGIVPYDLANQDRIIRGRMPTLEIINDNLARLFRNSLSSSLRKIIDVGPRGVQMMKFVEFVRTLPVPSSLHVFKMDPLRGHAILTLDSKLIFALVDIFLGGSGKTNFRVEGREFTAIETKLIRKVVNMFLADMEKAWSMVQSLTVRHVRSEINPQFVGIVPPSDLVVVIPWGIELEHFTGIITVCLPYSMIESIKNKLYSGYQSDHLEADHTWIKRFVDRLHTAEVEVVVELGRRHLMVSDLLKLQIGDVLSLENEVTDMMVALVQGVPKFLGKAGVCGSYKAFQVEEKIKAV
jgi:flagellar motor switch protein FliM